MNEGKFRSSLDEAHSRLRQWSLLRDVRTVERRRPTSALIDAGRAGDLNTLYIKCIEEGQYHFLLQDESLFDIVREDDGSLHYRFLEFPFDIAPYAHWLATYGLEETEAGESEREEYLQAVYESEAKQNSIICRYDFEPSYYKPFYHPASHLHIGANNQLRLAMDKVLTPEKFVSFVCRQHYRNVFALWSPEQHAELLSGMKNRCISLRDEHFTADEALDLFIA